MPVYEVLSIKAQARTVHAPFSTFAGRDYHGDNSLRRKTQNALDPGAVQSFHRTGIESVGAHGEHEMGTGQSRRLVGPDAHAPFADRLPRVRLGQAPPPGQDPLERGPPTERPLIVDERCDLDDGFGPASGYTSVREAYHDYCRWKQDRGGKTPGAKTVSRSPTQQPDSQIERDSPCRRSSQSPLSYRNGTLGLKQRKLSAMCLCGNNF